MSSPVATERASCLAQGAKYLVATFICLTTFVISVSAVTDPDGGATAAQGLTMYVDGVSVPLSTGEYSLLLALVMRPRAVLTRDQLLDLTQGREAAAFDRAIDNQVSRLRKKIEVDPKAPDIIKTVWGGGYTLSAEVTRL